MRACYRTLAEGPENKWQKTKLGLDHANSLS
jgi:hypothetical protein